MITFSDSLRQAACGITFGSQYEEWEPYKEDGEPWELRVSRAELCMDSKIVLLCDEIELGVVDLEASGYHCDQALAAIVDPACAKICAAPQDLVMPDDTLSRGQWYRGWSMSGDRLAYLNDGCTFIGRRGECNDFMAIIADDDAAAIEREAISRGRLAVYQASRLARLLADYASLGLLVECYMDDERVEYELAR